MPSAIRQTSIRKPLVATAKNAEHFQVDFPKIMNVTSTLSRGYKKIRNNVWTLVKIRGNVTIQPFGAF